MHRARLLAAGAAALLGTCSALAAADGLTLDERVAHQERLEEVYWRHRIWPPENPSAKPPLSAVLQESAIRSKVVDYLKKSRALETLWRRPLTAVQLQAEIDRMGRDTRDGATLRELHRALGDDPLLIAEVLARQTLVDRLIRDAYAQDERFEDTERPFDAWWSDERARFEIDIAATSGPYAIPKVSSKVCIDGTWEPTRLEVPDGRTHHTAVWTGAEMIVWGGANGLSLDSGGRYNPATDTWASTSRGAGAPLPRQLHTAVWTGTEMIVWGGNGPEWLDSGARYDPASDTWAATSSGAAARHSHTAVWTGTEMIVWGGSGPDSVLFADGGRYDPTTDTWSATAVVNAPTARHSHTAVWTGSEMIVWGGIASGVGKLDTGGRYRPRTNSWTPTSTAANVPSKRSSHTAVWTGTEMIVWGGNGAGYLSTGGRYDPEADSWAATSVGSNVPAKRMDHTAVWTGAEMIVWGGLSGTPWPAAGGRYDPSTDSWTPAPTGAGAPSARWLHSAVWTGNEMIVWGGYNEALERVKTGARYDPANNVWAPTTTGAYVPSERSEHTGVWTGAELIVWGGDTNGISSGGLLNTGGFYDPALDSWTATSTGANVPSARTGHTAVWTGTEMIVWGGYASGALGSGARCNPSTNTWISTSTSSAPTARSLHTATWTGTEMIIWGGLGAAGNLGSGARYNPSSNSWTTTAGFFDGRMKHTAVWTGTEMIVWGGEYHQEDEPGPYEPWYTQTGGRYNPSTNVWTATSTANAPTVRVGHTAVWSGTEMVVWGGGDAFGVGLGTGGRYDPARDAWTSTSQDPGAPAGRSTHSAVWTGTEMIVWGGSAPYPMKVFDSGGHYDPGADAWTPTAMGANLPTGRLGHTGVWTGTEMIVWGGYPYTSSGGRYCRSGCVLPALVPALVETMTAAKSGSTLELSWTPSENAVSYEVLRGQLTEWPVGSNPESESCFTDLTDTVLLDDEQPLAGGGFWYLVRGENSCGHGSWGWQESNGIPTEERMSSTCR